MEFRLLGPVEAIASGRRLALGPAKHRALLAALVIDAGRSVPVEVLIDRVWGEDPPRDARRTLRVYLSRLRAALAAGAPVDDLVHRDGAGYVLEVAPEDVDVHRFHRLVETSATAAGGAHRQRLLRLALDLWQGRPLDAVAGTWAANVRERLVQHRLIALQDWAHGEILGGRALGVVPELQDAVQAYPLVEPLAALLITALARSDRAAEGLAAYEACRARLADELGTQPGATLRRLHQALLQDEDPLPACDGIAVTSRPAGAPSLRPPPAPAQLPADVRGFAGRSDHLVALDSLLTRAHHARTVLISAVSGTAGVGKTALAVHWAHQVKHRFPDGQLHVDLRGYHPARQVVPAAEAVRLFLEALGVRPPDVPTSLDARVGLYRTLTAGRRLLILLDNARDAEHVRPLIAGAPHCLTLITSRDRLTGLVATDGAHPLVLDLLTADEARELLALRLGADRIAGEPAATDRIVSACARLPLALSIAAARAQQDDVPLAVLADDLGGIAGRLDALDAGDPMTRIRAVFSWSYSCLTPQAAQLFRLLALHPGPEITTAAAASLADVPPARAQAVLDDLVAANLVVERVPGRYGLHDLLRVYAGERLHVTDGAPGRRAALTRLLDHLVHNAHGAARLLYPQRDPAVLPLTPAATGTHLERFGDHDDAMRWFRAEQATLVAAAVHCAGNGSPARTWHLAWALDTYLERQGRWHEQSLLWQDALGASRDLRNLPARAHAHRALARAARRLGEYPQARAHLDRALDIYTELGHSVAQARTHLDLSYVWEGLEDCRTALHHAEQALELFRAVRYRQGQADGLNAVGWYHSHLGHHDEAVAHCSQALELFRHTRDREGQAATWDSLGYAHHRAGQHAAAIECYRQCMALTRDLGDRYGEATSHLRIGDTHHFTGDHAAARKSWKAALGILTDLDHADTEAVRTRLLRIVPN